jgi:hypothetical protein
VTAESYPSPITVDSMARLRSAAAEFVGQEIVAVHYLNLHGATWPGENASGAVDEVDMGVAIRLENMSELLIEWAMHGAIEGIDIRAIRGRRPSQSESDVSSNSQWGRFIGNRIDGLGAAWHPSDNGMPTLWAVRLSILDNDSVVIGLGAIEDGVPRYRPDTLLVIFDERLAKTYRPPDANESSFGGLTLRPAERR